METAEGFFVFSFLFFSQTYEKNCGLRSTRVQSGKKNSVSRLFLCFKNSDQFKWFHIMV